MAACTSLHLSNPKAGSPILYMECPNSGKRRHWTVANPLQVHSHVPSHITSRPVCWLGADHPQRERPPLHSVSLIWNPVTDAGAYKVEYRRSSSISWLHAGYVYSSTSDTVDGLDCDTSYDFRVRARGDGSPYSYTYGNPSSSVSETTDACPAPAPPPAPQNLTGASGPGREEASLNWDSVAEATGYMVEQRKRRRFARFLHTWVELDSEVTITGSSAVVRALSVNNIHRFRVKALKADAESEPSNEVEVTLAPPPAPTNVAGSSVDHGEIRIMWDAVLGATGYVVEQHKNVLIGSNWHELPFDEVSSKVCKQSGGVPSL